MSNNAAHEPRLTILENALMQHERKLDDSKERTHELDKKFLELHAELKTNSIEVKAELRKQGHDIKSILSQLTIINNFDERLKSLEDKNRKQEVFLKRSVNCLIFLGKYWYVWMLVIICFFAFDLRLEVQNPHLAQFIFDKLHL